MQFFLVSKCHNGIPANEMNRELNKWFVYSFQIWFVQFRLLATTNS